MPKGGTIFRKVGRGFSRTVLLPAAPKMTDQTRAIVSGNATPSPIDQLHEVIDACRVCEAKIPNLCKPLRMHRGAPAAAVMIVGQGPGRKVRAAGYAFAGQSGRRLDRWLRHCRAQGGARD